MLLSLLISCNNNNVFINNKVVYLSIKQGEFLIEGDVDENLNSNRFELERILSKKEINNLNKITDNLKYQKDNIDIIDCPVEGCYVFYENGQPKKVIYNLSNGQKLFIYEIGKTKKTIYVKTEICKIP
ncbi:hypothetical protein GKZ90_0022290 [Flavobacterium sp. MC2016-06]|uniref:hypothetical protein n=1 Tax=Flavobacterium sp. MC2016-06 TaxID=2676308 RepID=UPI0031D95082